MDYNRLFRRAATLVWEHKFLIVLGILAAFSSGTGSNNGSRNGLGGDNGSFQNGDQLPEGLPGIPGIPQDAPFVAELQEFAAAVPAGVALLVCLALLAVVVLYIVGTIARGGLIAGVDALEKGEKTSLGQAWSAGRRRGWTLIGIGILPAIPALTGLLLGLAGMAASGGLAYLGRIASFPSVGLSGFFGVLMCILLPISLVLGLLRTFANRAAMLEGMGVLAAYGRGFSVLVENLGSALVIFIIQVVISLLLGLLLLLPGIVVALCCVLWPLFFIFQGFMAAFFSAVWTLAWRQWTDALPVNKIQ